MTLARDIDTGEPKKFRITEKGQKNLDTFRDRKEELYPYVKEIQRRGDTSWLIILNTGESYMIYPTTWFLRNYNTDKRFQARNFDELIGWCLNKEKKVWNIIIAARNKRHREGLRDFESGSKYIGHRDD